jgi:hypothetical protein
VYVRSSGVEGTVRDRKRIDRTHREQIRPSGGDGFSVRRVARDQTLPLLLHKSWGLGAREERERQEEPFLVSSWGGSEIGRRVEFTLMPPVPMNWIEEKEGSDLWKSFAPSRSQPDTHLPV